MKTTGAVVTGAAGGIGRALAVSLASEGHHAHLVDVEPTEALAAEIGGTAHQVDVTDPAAMEHLAACVHDVEVVCLNAGILGPSLGAPWETPPQEWQRLLAVNVIGVVNGLRAFVPRLTSRPGPTRIIITASLAGLVSFPGGGAYAATKHAVVAIAEQAALALAETRVSVTLLCPALVRTGMSNLGEDPSHVATAALNASRARRFLVVPNDWAPALRDRVEVLLLGVPPQVPISSAAAG